VNLKRPISTKVEQTCWSALRSGRRGNAALPRCHAFTLVEILVVVVLLAMIVLAMMAVFNSTQTAFRASLTQADVLEGGRSVMGLIKTDMESLTPSFGRSNVVLNGGYYGFIPANAPVNFCVVTNQYQYRSNSLPLLQSLPGAGNPNTLRTNVLDKFFFLTRQNTTWTGIGYVVDTTSTNYFNPLYRFMMTTNLSAPNMPWGLYTNFLANSLLPVSPTNPSLSHLQDGVMQLTVRAYDPNGYWMTNTVVTNAAASFSGTNRNIRFQPPAWGEITCYMFSNTLPASVGVELGMLEDRAIQRALSLPDVAPVWARSNYLAQQAGKVHLFRQRIPIRNVDRSAYQ
jgi:hypothetical protein